MSCRQSPTVLCFAGENGCGKSFLSIYIARCLCENLSIPFSNVYFRNPFCEHWDGYNEGSQIIVYDDMYADVFDDNSTTYKEIIQLVSVTPFHATFAALEDKGKLVDPKFVIITTNHPYPPYKCDLGALFRRHHLLIYCTKMGTNMNSNFDHLELRLFPSKDFPKIAEKDDPYFFKNLSKHPFYKTSYSITIKQIVYRAIEHYVKEREIYCNVINAPVPNISFIGNHRQSIMDYFDKEQLSRVIASVMIDD